MGKNVGKAIGKAVGKGTSEKQQLINRGRIGQRVICVDGCSFSAKKNHASNKFKGHFKKSHKCAEAVRDIIQTNCSGEATDHKKATYWLKKQKWLPLDQK